MSNTEAGATEIRRNQVLQTKPIETATRKPEKEEEQSASGSNIWGDDYSFKYSYPTSDQAAVAAMAFAENRDFQTAAPFMAAIAVTMNRSRSPLNFLAGPYAPVLLQLYAKNQYDSVTGPGKRNYLASLNGLSAVMQLPGAGFKTRVSYYLAQDIACSALRTGIPDLTEGHLFFRHVPTGTPAPDGYTVISCGPTDPRYDMWLFR